MKFPPDRPLEEVDFASLRLTKRGGVDVELNDMVGQMLANEEVHREFWKKQRTLKREKPGLFNDVVVHVLEQVGRTEEPPRWTSSTHLVNDLVLRSKHVIIDLRRKCSCEKRTPPGERKGLEAVGLQASDQPFEFDEWARVEEVLPSLSVRDQQLLRMYSEGCSAEERTKACGFSSKGHMRLVLMQALGRLRVLLGLSAHLPHR